MLLTSSFASAATVTLQRGQTGMLGRQQVTVISVQDNRCPMNARCIRAGELIAKVLVKQEGRWRFLTLQTPENAGTVWAGLRIADAAGKLTTDRTPVQITFTDEKLSTR
ncbi:hypothetical protein D3875_12570 [Deinococcus cavernae]|uniref:Uncharacterized protein n=1 Tax=Deinococcus cavernae TaxID=2320857 RepID=A0A418VCJ7_9DEIO|nr:hypothetical protein D3875_12570 [Deinococcus cavernae]